MYDMYIINNLYIIYIIFITYISKYYLIINMIHIDYPKKMFRAVQNTSILLDRRTAHRSETINVTWQLEKALSNFEALNLQEQVMNS